MIDDIQEEWKPVVGFENAYEVSSYGRIRRIGAARGAKAGRVLKVFLCGPPKKQYYYASLSDRAR